MYSLEGLAPESDRWIKEWGAWGWSWSRGRQHRQPGGSHRDHTRGCKRPRNTTSSYITSDWAGGLSKPRFLSATRMGIYLTACPSKLSSTVFVILFIVVSTWSLTSSSLQPVCGDQFVNELPHTKQNNKKKIPERYLQAKGSGDSKARWSINETSF